jgi:WXG100 family type VII secretion target
MDIRIIFEDLEQMARSFNAGAQQYTDAIQALQSITSNFDNGGFLGRCGQNFSALLQNDRSAFQQFEQVFEQAVRSLGETASEMQDADQNMQSQMP